VYGFIASVLPVWMLLCPRDYLSTFLKIATVLVLGVAILIILPPLRMPALTPFATAGEGPVFAGKLFPFAFITIAAGDFRFPLARRLRHDAQDDHARNDRADDRLRRNGHGIVCWSHGDDRGLHARSGRLLSR